ncbi:MAG: cyclophane-forming radical SAM/SPASM peptide maturase GrrM/OscB [Vulcanococcus sp.]
MADAPLQGGPGGGPLRLLVMQPTPFCNLDCDYCYLPSRDDRSRLSLELLDAALERVLESPYFGGPFTLLWHAGEPLTVPPAFYDAATARIQAALARHALPPDTIRQSLQTNAIAINQAWVDCFIRNAIHVGVSLDGPAFLHDAHRITRTGRPSHAAVMRGIGWLQRCGVPFNVIAVLTADGLDHADALYDFFAEAGISEVGFNMEETEGENACSSLDRSSSATASTTDTQTRYRRFMERFWQRTREEPGRVNLREFDGITSLACSNQRLSQTDMNSPFVIVNVDAHGRVSSFDPELLAVHTERFGDFVFGHVLHDRLVDIAATAKFQQVRDEIAAGVQACRSSCEYFGLCGGGAGSNKYWEHGRFDGTATQHCRYRIQLVADVVLEGMERELGLAA